MSAGITLCAFWSGWPHARHLPCATDWVRGWVRWFVRDGRDSCGLYRVSSHSALMRDSRGAAAAARPTRAN